MNATLLVVAQAVNGRLQPASAGEVAVQSVDIDTRRLQAHSLFVALVGSQQDGHDFLPAAAAAGARAAIVREAQAAELPQIVVADTIAALRALAYFWRCELAVKIAAVTGSNGKTTVKEMLHAIMTAAAGEDAVLASGGNFNNHLGVPLSLLKLKPAHEWAVLEAGMDHAGELTDLSKLIAPQVAVINNAQRAHIGNFESVEGIARAKGELLSGLSPQGIAVLNADDPHFSLWCELAAGREVVSFGRSAQATVQAEWTPQGIAIDGAAIPLALPGMHNKMNALAAAAAARALGLPMEAVLQGLSAVRGVAGRLHKQPLTDALMLIDDSYNANPDSAAAAVAVLVDEAKGSAAHPLLVMGDMLALGASAAAEHLVLLELCRQHGVSVFGVGDFMKAAQEESGVGAHFDQCDDLPPQVHELAKQHGKLCVLVKGSRGMKMEQAVSAIKDSIAMEAH